MNIFFPSLNTEYLKRNDDCVFNKYYYIYYNLYDVDCVVPTRADRPLSRKGWRAILIILRSSVIRIVDARPDNNTVLL